MKNLAKMFLILTFLTVSIIYSYADSPITSTEFYTAYNDIDIVNKALRLGSVNDEIATYLLSNKNSIDKKAAVCNALSWNIDGKNNAALLTDFLAAKYKTTKNDLNFEILNADELLCLGYLTVLDNYFDPKPALIILKKSKAKNPDSYTINIIYALVQAQIYFDDNKWCNVWVVCDEVRNNNSLNMDLREKAINAIFEYIDIYKEECKE